MSAATASATASPDQQRDTDNRRTIPSQLPLPPSYDRVTKGIGKILFVIWASAMIYGLFGGFFGGNAPTPFDISAQSITFHPAGSLGSMVSGNRRVRCFNGESFDVSVQVTRVGHAPAYKGDPKSGPQIRFSGRPVDGHPGELVEVSKPMSEMRRAKSSESGSYFFTATLPPSFAGRDIAWTATIWHPNDRQANNNQVANVTLPACAA